MKFQKKMVKKIILASKSLVRKKILEENGIKCIVEPSNVDEDLIKESLLKDNITPKLISKSLAEFKANKVSQKKNGNLVNDIEKSDIILLGVSRTSKTPTSIYLANRGLKTSNIPLVNEHSVPELLRRNPKITCVVGLTSEAERLVDIRKNRMNTLYEIESTNYINLEKISKEVEAAKKTFKKYKWPTIDVTRKSVEEIAASVIKIYEISKENV